MSKAEKMMLEDAFMTAIQAERKVIKLKIVVAILSVALVSVSAYLLM